ncbi:MAG: POTRA domain-containing protein [Pseudomonadota bacterium]
MTFKGLSLVLLLLSLAAAPVQADSFEGRKIARIEVKSSDSTQIQSLEEFFRAEIGDVFSADRVTKAIRKVYAGRSIYQVRATETDAGDQVVVTIDVDSKPTVEAIEFRENASIPTAELEGHIGVTVGDSVTPETLAECQKRLTEYYTFRGFTASKVNVSSEKAEGSKIRILARIEEGTPCTIESVQLNLTKPVMKPGEALALMGISKGGRCDGEEIRSGVRHLEQTLRKSGRLAVSYQDPVVEYSEDRKRARITAEVNPGSVIRVVFRGNTFAFERNAVLEKTVALEEERQFSRGWIEGTAIDGIQTFYRGRGYPDVKVAVDDAIDESADVRTITFRIDRGTKMWLGGVYFKGDHALGLSDLRGAFFDSAAQSIREGAFVQMDLDSGAQGVIALYQSKGYLRADISQPQIRTDAKKRKAYVTYEVREGEQTILSEYRILGNQLFDNAAIQDWMKLRPGQPMDPVALEKAAGRIEERYHEKGYKFASVSVPKIGQLPAGPAAYQIDVHEGSVVEFGQVMIRGNLHTNDSVIRRVVKVREGERYSPEAIRETRRRISELGFFTQLAIEEVNYDPSTGREDVVITVEERKKRSVRLRPGYSTEKGVRMAADLTYLNIAGTGRSATVTTEVSRRVPEADLTEYKVIGTFLEPSVFNIATGRVNVIQERQEEQQFDIDRTSLILGLDREWLRWLRSTLQWELEFRNPFNVQTGATLSPFDEASARFGSIASIVDFDFRNDVLNPIRGSFHRIRFDIFNKSLASQVAFWQVFSRNTFYAPIYRRIRVVTAVRVGFASTYGSTKSQGIMEVPIEKRFRLGGATSLRGFSRNCVGGVGEGAPEDCSASTFDQAPGGNSMFNYQTDLLLPLSESFDFALFTDGGEAFPLNSDFSFVNIRTSAGVGLRYNGFFGPVRLDLGFKLDRRPGESLTEVSFSIGQF